MPVRNGKCLTQVDKNMKFIPRQLTYFQGVEAVRKAVKESWDAGVFMVFLIIDKQRCSESILDVRTPSKFL